MQNEMFRREATSTWNCLVGKRLILVTVAAVGASSLAVYVNGYYVLSRHRIAMARKVGATAFRFTDCDSTESRERNDALLLSYGPLLTIERVLGTGMPAAVAPLHDLE